MKTNDKPPSNLEELDESDEGHQIGLRLPESLYRDLRRAADKDRLLVSEYLRKIIRDTLNLIECDECGESGVPEDASYCPYCGTEFEEPEDEDRDEEEEKEEKSEKEDEEEDEAD